MPRREVHIIAAASGAGKTTLMVQILDDLIEGREVFESPTHPVNVVYLCNDRSGDDLRRTMERIQTRNTFPAYSLLTDPQFKSAQSIANSLRQVKALHPECDFIVFDPISRQVDNVNSAREVGNLLCKLTELAQELDFTLLIVHHSAKVKTDAFYANPRQKMAGCGAWGGYSNLNLILEEDQESNPTNPIRGLHVCPRNGANRYYRYILDDLGCFAPAPKKEDDPAKRREKDDEIFNALPFGELTVSQLYEALGEPTNGSLYRSIARWVHAGNIEKIKRGVYTKIRANS
jgi:AAA domain